LLMEYRYDNSAANARNPHHPPQRVRYGPNSADEMAELLVQVLPVNPRDLGVLRRIGVMRAIAEDIDVQEQRLRENPRDSDARRLAGTRLLQLGRLPEATEHFRELSRLLPDSADARFWLGDALARAAEFDAATAEFEAALRLDQNHLETLTALARVLATHPVPAHRDAWRAVALAENAAHQGALVLMGHVLLRRGQVQEAWEHARSALSEDATDAEALQLLCEVKARTSWFLGLWWRWNSWLNVLGDSRQIVVLLGLFLLYRVARQLAHDLDRPGLASVLNLVWLGFVVYTWVGPGMFQRMLRRELRGVRLDDRY